MQQILIIIWQALKLGLNDNPLPVARIRAYMCSAVMAGLYFWLMISLLNVTVFSIDPHNNNGTKIADNKNRFVIYDRNNEILANDLPLVSLKANPSLLLDVDDAIKKTLEVFPNLDEKKLTLQLNKKSARYVEVKKDVTPKQHAAINKLGIPGFYFEHHERRFYLQKNLFSHVLGFVGNDNRGLQGLERAFNKRDDTSIFLSLDAGAQFIMHEELHKSIRKHRAIGGSGIIMDVKTREILAMVSLPDFNPHSNPNDIIRKTRFNSATQGVYEFGSTLKIFNTALSLHNGRSLTHDIYDARKPLSLGGDYRISDYHAQNREMNIAEIFIHSSNIGSALMAWQNGADYQKNFLRELGLLDRVDTNYPEIGTPQYPSPWKNISVATVSYGYGISISPLHLVNAVATVIGDGHHRPPSFMLGGEGEANEEGKAVLDSQTILQMRSLLRLNVLKGSGKRANIEGYRVGGKTGTAEKFKTGGGGYDRDRLISNFVGAFPMENPRYVIFVMLDEPKPTGRVRPTGGVVAAPVVGKVVRRLAPIFNILPEVEKEKIQDEELYLPILQVGEGA